MWNKVGWKLKLQLFCGGIQSHNVLGFIVGIIDSETKQQVTKADTWIGGGWSRTDHPQGSPHSSSHLIFDRHQ